MLGSCQVTMIEGGLKRLDELRPGDRVLSGSLDKYMTIKCIIQTDAKSKRQYVRFPTGLIITPYHPVFGWIGSDGPPPKWSFPIDLVAPDSVTIKRPRDVWLIDQENVQIFSFVCEGVGNSILINSIPCICLGTGPSKTPVINHKFFSSLEAMQLETFPGWKRGHIKFQDGCMIRDAEGNVVAFDRAKCISRDEDDEDDNNNNSSSSDVAHM